MGVGQGTQRKEHIPLSVQRHQERPGWQVGGKPCAWRHEMSPVNPCEWPSTNLPLSGFPLTHKQRSGCGAAVGAWPLGWDWGHGDPHNMAPILASWVLGPGHRPSLLPSVLCILPHPRGEVGCKTGSKTEKPKLSSPGKASREWETTLCLPQFIN